MMRKTLTPVALGFAALVSLAACGGGDEAADGALTDTGASTLPAPAPAPAPPPATDSLADPTRPDRLADTTRRDTTTTPPPGA